MAKPTLSEFFDYYHLNYHEAVTIYAMNENRDCHRQVSRNLKKAVIRAMAGKHRDRLRHAANNWEPTGEHAYFYNELKKIMTAEHPPRLRPTQISRTVTAIRKAIEDWAAPPIPSPLHAKRKLPKREDIWVLLRPPNPAATTAVMKVAIQCVLDTQLWGPRLWQHVYWSEDRIATDHDRELYNHVVTGNEKGLTLPRPRLGSKLGPCTPLVRSQAIRIIAWLKTAPLEI